MIQKLFLLPALLCSSSCVFGTTCVYQGANYGSVSAPACTTAMKATGSFTSATALPPNLPGQDIGPKGTNPLTSSSFSDGVNTRSTATSNVYTFLVVTDGVGAITQFSIVPATPQAPHVVNGLLDELAIATPQTVACTGIPSMQSVLALLLTVVAGWRLRLDPRWRD